MYADQTVGGAVDGSTYPVGQYQIHPLTQPHREQVEPSPRPSHMFNPVHQARRRLAISPPRFDQFTSVNRLAIANPTS